MVILLQTSGVHLGTEVSFFKEISKLTKGQATKAGYRSIFEFYISKLLKKVKKKFRYEKIKIAWFEVQKKFYVPDFVLDNGIIIEVKGWFKQSDRVKHLRIKKQHPNLDIRFVFQNENNKLYRGSPTTYAKWCEQHNFKFANRIIPKEWLKEKGKDKHPNIIENNIKEIIYDR